MPNELTFEYIKEIYSLAVNTQRSRNWIYAINLYETVVESADQFYTPFALAGVAHCYNELGNRDLETATFKRVTQLPKRQQRLLNPGWLALCYQRSGAVGEARTIHAETLKLVPHDLEATSALAELSLIEGRLDQADIFAAELQQRAEPAFQILGRIIRALANALRNKHDEAAEELSWVGRFIVSSGSIPVGLWDYSDLQPLVPKAGPNANALGVLFEALGGKIPYPDFTAKWGEIAPSSPTRA